MSKIKTTANIVKAEQISENIFSIWVKEEKISTFARPGQFVSLYCADKSKLLPRPISICEVNKEEYCIRLVYRVVGEGTKEFSSLKENDTIELMGPLGNGFTLEGTKAILIGGGIGIPPMLELAKQLNCEKQIVLGYRDHLFLKEEFELYGTVFWSTEDGSTGIKGNVIDVINKNQLEADIIYACGPIPMLRGVKAYAEEYHIKTQLSLEERMACGIGACLACVCKSKEKDSYTNVTNKRVCKDGPVFYAEEVDL